MATCTLQNVLDDARAYLGDTAIPGGEVFTNSILLPHFSEPYRSMFGRLQGASKRVERTIVVVLPANQSVLIPSTAGILDLAEPEMVEERQAPASITITSTNTSTPIVVTAPNHGLGSPGQVAQGNVSGVLGTTSPWGNWFATIIDANSFSLNGSASDGVVGTGGAFYPWSALPFTEVEPVDLWASGLDGQPQQVLGVYLWENEMFSFRGATVPVQLRITYYASGTPPTNPNYVIGIDNCRDFLGVATAANAATPKGWDTMAEKYRNRAYGDPSHPLTPGLLDVFMGVQVLALQRGPQRRQQPFRDKRYKWGTYLLG